MKTDLSKSKRRSTALSRRGGSTSVSPCAMKCPKCGSDDIHREHKEEGDAVELDYADRGMTRENEFVAINGWTDARVKRECIMHHCRCCQYEWETAPLGGSNADLRHSAGSAASQPKETAK